MPARYNWAAIIIAYYQSCNLYIAYVTPGVIRNLIKKIFRYKQTNVVSLYNSKIYDGSILIDHSEHLCRMTSNCEN